MELMCTIQCYLQPHYIGVQLLTQLEIQQVQTLKHMEMHKHQQTQPALMEINKQWTTAHKHMEIQNLQQLPLVQVLMVIQIQQQLQLPLMEKQLPLLLQQLQQTQQLLLLPMKIQLLTKIVLLQLFILIPTKPSPWNMLMKTMVQKKLLYLSMKSIQLPDLKHSEHTLPLY